MKLTPEEKTTLTYSAIAALLGAIAHLLRQELTRAEQERARATEDAVARYYHERGERES